MQVSFNKGPFSPSDPGKSNIKLNTTMKYNRRFKTPAGFLLAAFMLSAALPGHSVSAEQATNGDPIVFTAGGADVTFFYDSVENRFDTVLRSKGDTVAEGLNTPYGTPPGGVGGGNDFVFSTLSVILNGPPIFEVDGHDYYVSPASGGFFSNPDMPDLGIRTRLREGDPAVDQFSALRWTLNLSGSQMPDGAEFILFGADDLGTGTEILIDTEHGDLTHDWPAYGHTHWHWGFSHHGEYDLNFDIEGIDGEYGDAEATGNFSVHFSVNPLWFGYPVGSDYFVHTEELGLLYVEHRPWVYSYDLRRYVYMSEEADTEAGVWIYNPR